MHYSAVGRMPCQGGSAHKDTFAGYVGGSGSSIGNIVVLNGGIAAAFAIIAARGWYARRRWGGSGSARN